MQMDLFSYLLYIILDWYLQAKGKVKKAENMLRKLHENREPSELPTDLEILSPEERFLFRKMGLSMKPFLLLGKRCCLFNLIVPIRITLISHNFYISVQGGEMFLMEL